MQQQLTPNTLLHGGTYKIVKVLGQGSFGITYLAEHVNLGRKVAIKEFFMKELNSRGDDGSITGMTEGGLSYNYARKFQKEAQNLSRLDHPNIVRVTDSFEDNGTYYYVMDYIDGQNLNDYVKYKAVSESEAISIIKDVADALIYMHEEKHMLHLDLKPGNVMRRNSDGHIFLIDFGLSKHYSNDGQPETSTTIGLGTAGYAPIEQGNKAKDGEFRPTIDVYALGATLYKLLTRETPPAASELVSDDELLVDKLKEKSVSQNLIDFIVKAMLPNVRKRIQSIRSFKDMLPVGSSSADTTGYGSIGNDEETVFVDESGEETELVETVQKTQKHPDFKEETYVIESNYVNNPTTTATKAQEGDVDAAIAYGMMALRGNGVNQDSDTAYEWFMLAKNSGDDRGEKLVEQWYLLKDKYKKTITTKADSSKNTNKSSNNNTAWWFIGIVIGVIVLLVGVNKYKEEQAQEAAIAAAEAERAEKSRKASIAKSVTDWYIDNSNNVYCVVEGQNYYVDLYGIPDGQRTLHYGSNFSESTFTGTFSGGRKYKGKLTYRNGDYFDGTFSDSTLFYGSKDTGYGKETNYDGSHVYEGNYKNGMWNGKGTESWPKEKRKNWGCMLECSYKNNQRHGVGTWYFNNHTYSKRRFKNGKEGSTIEEGTWR